MVDVFFVHTAIHTNIYLNINKFFFNPTNFSVLLFTCIYHKNNDIILFLLFIAIKVLMCFMYITNRL